jgi:NADP-dependent aldehyde dehydrogenase
MKGPTPGGSSVTPPVERYQTTPHDLDDVLSRAAAAAPRLAASRPRDRATMLRSVAGDLDSAGGELVPLAQQETHLAEERLRGELGRTTYQLRMFADVLDEGSILEAIIDTRDREHPLGPRPDLRRVLVPLGPVVVFAASNFPFAFSVAGNDTASALAAGCPVLLKAHPGHPRLSRRTAEIVSTALSAAGAPLGAFALIEGVDAGTAVLVDPRVTAGSFTGSIPGGRALFDLANRRPAPIPFYGEMGSLNPVVVTTGAAARRGRDIVAGLVQSFTLGVGQFCTKPGLIFLPSGHGLEETLAAAVRGVAAAPLLNDRIAAGFGNSLSSIAAVPGVEVLADGSESPMGCAAPTVLITTAAVLRDNADALLQEAFGPATLVAEYDDTGDLHRTLELLEGNLTATIHGEEAEADELAPIVHILTERAGRVLWNGWPTGVAVTWAMHHGGPYPATTSPLHTSVGVVAVRRFQRPVCYQDFVQALLPEALRDRNVLGLPRRVDGVITTADVVEEDR